MKRHLKKKELLVLYCTHKTALRLLTVSHCPTAVHQLSLACRKNKNGFHFISTIHKVFDEGYP